MNQLAIWLHEFVDESRKSAYGTIIIGDFRERFYAPLTFWSARDYVKQWEQAFERLQAGHDASALISGITDPAVSQHLFWWPMYVERETIVVQNQMLIHEQLSEPFNVDDPYRHIGPLEHVTDEGQRISACRVGIDKVKHAIASTLI